MTRGRAVASGHTPLFRQVRRWLRCACAAPAAVEATYEQWARGSPTRREPPALGVLKPTLRTQAAATQVPNAPRIVIVGAGMAGLTAAYYLQQYGLTADLYESSTRTGGRIYSAQGLFAPELTTELGGEFINSNHHDMLAFVKRFELTLIDAEAPSETNLRTHYFFNGRAYTEPQIIDALRPIARRMAQDAQRAGYPITYRQHTAYARQLDTLSLAEYLRRVGASGWLYELLEVAYVTEYGLDAGEQSCLNMLLMIDTNPRDGFDLLGESDERYKVRGGNQQVPDLLAERLRDRIYLGHRLVALRETLQGYCLTFERAGGGSVETQADFVVLTLPFTRLRTVEMRVALPPVKRRAIAELGYGANAKLILGMRHRFWRGQGLSGDFYTDEPFQSGWDSSRLQPGTRGSLTLFLGGTPSVRVGQGTPQAQAAAFLPKLERVLPGARAHYTGKAHRFHWRSHPHTQGSYSCWKARQYTTLAGAEFEPVGRLYFAGEHTSLDYQGYMNGAAETGRRVAQRIYRQVRR
jgi:monoamine oxidase